MKKGLRIFINILETIAVIPLSIIGVILLSPFLILYLLFALPTVIIEDIWDIEPLPFSDGTEHLEEIEKGE